MLKSKDDLIRVEIICSITDAIPPVTDFSIFNIPKNKADAEQLFQNIYSMPTDKHLTLMLCRHIKRDKLKALSNFACSKELEYVDTVSMTYQETNYRGAGLSTLSEIGALFYKGDEPNFQQTSWFRTETHNASNHWDLSPYKDDNHQENPVPSTNGRFSWDLALLMATACGPMHHKRFLYCLPNFDDNLLLFVKSFGIGAHLYAPNVEEGQAIIEKYESLKLKKKS